MAEIMKGVDGEDYVQVGDRWFKGLPAAAVLAAPPPEEGEGGGGGVPEEDTGA